MSFCNRKPVGVSPHWTNIIHYTKDKTNAGPEGRVPGMYLANIKTDRL